MIEIEITKPDQLWDWLAEHHAETESVILTTFKAADREKYVSRDEVLDALMAHGWIDGRRFAVDDKRTAQLITQRKQQAWAESYKQRVARLTREGRMHPAGHAVVEAGKASGLWDFYADVDALIVPDDLAEQIEMVRWDAFPPSYQRNVLRWIKTAKTPLTRAKRITAVVQSTLAGRKLPQM